MQLIINGKTEAVADGLTVEALLGSLGINRTQVAVEKNGAIVPRSRHGETLLSEGDRIEMVQFIGGG